MGFELALSEFLEECLVLEPASAALKHVRLEVVCVARITVVSAEHDAWGRQCRLLLEARRQDVDSMGREASLGRVQEHGDLMSGGNERAGNGGGIIQA